jgi:endonuclease YncB( thermonuclease family)
VSKSPQLIFLFTVTLGIALITQYLSIVNNSIFAHRDGCHRWHSCPSDNGSYVCGDLGYDDQCPKKSKSKKDDSDKTNSRSKSNKDKKTDKAKKKNTSSTAKIENIQPITRDGNITSGIPVTDSVDPSIITREGIEIAGPVTEVIDGDTVDISGSIRIRLALVNTPEVGQTGFDTAKNFVEDLCLFKNGEVDMDEGQRQGSFGREIGMLHCEGVNVNQALMNNSLGTISTEFCDVSEFADEVWAATYC